MAVEKKKYKINEVERDKFAKQEGEGIFLKKVKENLNKFEKKR